MPIVNLNKYSPPRSCVDCSMAVDEALSRSGLHFDELNKFRILEPDVSQKTSELKEECKEFVEKIATFQKIVGTFIDVVDIVANEVEKEKMKIGLDRDGKILQERGCLLRYTLEAKHRQTIIFKYDQERVHSKAIGARNLLKSIAKQREAKQQQLKALIREKKMQLERLQTQYISLSKEETEQNEFIVQFILQK